QISMARIMAGRTVSLGPEARQHVHRQQVHAVHQENPDEYGQRQRGHELAALGIVDHALGLGSDIFGQDFDRRLEAAGHTGSRLAGRAPQKIATQHAQDNGVNQGVQIEKAEVNNAALLDTLKGEIHLQMLQMVNDVFASGRTLSPRMFSSHNSPITNTSNTFYSNLVRWPALGAKQ